MRAADVVGKKILRVKQAPVYDSRTQETVWLIDGLELSDGSWLYFHGVELEDEGPAVRAQHVRKEPRHDR